MPKPFSETKKENKEDEDEGGGERRAGGRGEEEEQEISMQFRVVLLYSVLSNGIFFPPVETFAALPEENQL